MYVLISKKEKVLKIGITSLWPDKRKIFFSIKLKFSWSWLNPIL